MRYASLLTGGAEMSTAKEEYYSFQKEFPTPKGVKDHAANYIAELEQELHDSELRRKDLLTSLQRANAQKAELEQQNKQMLEYLKECYKRFKEYELDVDVDRPYHHINFMKKIEEVLK